MCFNAIDFDKIQDFNVTVGLWDRIFGTGSVTGTSASQIPGISFVQFSSIQNPYDVYKILKEVGFVIKAYIDFPNAFRPRVNKGYGTKYQPE